MREGEEGIFENASPAIFIKARVKCAISWRKIKNKIENQALLITQSQNTLNKATIKVIRQPA